MLEWLDESARNGLHAELARSLPAAEAARHYAAAGDRPRPREAAIRAASEARFPGERARHLVLAVECSDCAARRCAECDDTALVFDAVEAFLEAGEPLEADRALTLVDESEFPAEVALARIARPLGTGRS